MLKFDHVDVSVGNTPILKDISFHIKKGSITTIVGPNGCGKTTLLQTLNGGSKITKGTVTVSNINIQTLSSRQRARYIALLPQVRTIIPALPVKTLVEHGRFPYLGFGRQKKEEDHIIVQNAMEYTNVDSYSSQYVDTLSGGIRQRVFLAMILAQDSDLIVLDEPTTYLDLEGQRIILSLISDLKKQGKTILLVLHDLHQALRISDEIIVMNDRHVISVATPTECINSHVLEDIFHTKCKVFSDAEGNYYFFS